MLRTTEAGGLFTGSLIAHLAPGPFFKLRFVFFVEEVALLGITLADGMVRIDGKLLLSQVAIGCKTDDVAEGRGVCLFACHCLIAFLLIPYYLFLDYFLSIDNVNAAGGMQNATTL